MSHRTEPSSYEGNTREQILEISANMFAHRGFKGATLKDVAKAVGIKMASLYYYFDGKDALVEAVLERFWNAHKEYDKWLRKSNEEAKTLEDVMDNLFSEKFLTDLDSTARLGLSLTLKEQHSYKAAKRFIVQDLYKDGMNSVQLGFDRLIEKGIIPESDTKTLASLYMFCVMALNEIHIHEAEETEMPIDRAEVYSGFRTLLTCALENGILDSNK